MANDRLVVILSDLGTRDPAICQFKAAVVTINPEVRFLDATHEIRPHDLLEAAFTLGRIFEEFPSRTIFALLLDQHRGAPKRPLLAVTMEHFYFAPDNGVLSFVYRKDPPSSVYHVTAEHYIETTAAPLAHHSQVYGSAVGWLSKGIESSNFGEPVTDFVQTQLPTAQRPQPQQIAGMVLHVDRFGSLVTNIPADLINATRHALGAQVPFQARIGDAPVPIIGGWQEGGPEVFGLYNASGFLEVCSAKGEAAKVLGAKRGDAAHVLFGG
jgi:S-adenosylmethionine hydrolase